MEQMQMLKIGDFSRLGQVTTRTLRHYDKLGLLQPQHTDRSSGYRYYSLAQLPSLHRILALRDLGFSLEQIKDLVEQDLSVEQMRGMLAARQTELAEELRAGMEQLDRVAARLNQLEQGEDTLDEYEVVIKSVPDLTAATIKATVPYTYQVGDYCDAHFAALFGWLKAYGIKPAGPTFNLFHETEYVEENIHMETGIVLDGVPDLPDDAAHEEVTVRTIKGAPTAASLIDTFSFNDLTTYIQALIKWVTLRGYTSTGALREVHLFGDAKSIDSDEPAVMELQIPIEKADYPFLS